MPLGFSIGPAGFTIFGRKLFRAITRIEARLEDIMASVQEMLAELGRINASTTSLGGSISDVAADITALLQIVRDNPTPEGLQTVQDGLRSAADTLEGFASTLAGVASQFPPPPQG